MKRVLLFIAVLLLAWIIGTLIHAWHLYKKGVVIYVKHSR